ncbi:hypothetical protein GCM10023166_27720 [Paeniglutamicibacter cryotolerans]
MSYVRRPEGIGVALAERICRPRDQWEGMAEGRAPNHCSAPGSWKRATSENPVFSVLRTDGPFADWVHRTAGSSGDAVATEASAAAHASVI